ncbi:alpha/beta fold hydrolase [Bradyrhizobium sp. GCM10027634]|uniref:alpha/beta fold hydrolase n=1 Tax=unclassified Bradyrhizobium TaxID=2631580 RepID=UPI001FEDD53F|nr:MULTISPECIES: alpha/beta fold hydrolase [unclassified Bradyrhizobium]MDN5000569.1 alpha/beta fold hydrolase [Bradyrhizobium sp. WYCCWR 12677]
MIGGLAAGVGAASATSFGIDDARAQSARKTFVLIGGAFYGAWCWHRVTERLEKQGHKVYAFTLSGLAERSHLLSKEINLDTHITDIANLVEWEDLKDICLVAHSYAGCPASGALERIGSRVSAIVWVDAVKPADGQAFRDLVPFPIEDGAISRPAPKALPPTAFSDPQDVAWVLSKVTPQPIGTWLQPVKLSGAREKVAKKTYIRLPKFQLAALDKAAAECRSDSSWTVLENTTSGHSVMISQPDWLTDVLVKAA